MPKLDLTDTEKKFGSLVEEQIGPNVKAAMEDIQRRQGTDAAYKQGQIDAILSTAREQDEALKNKQTEITTPGEAAQGETAETTGDGGQPPGVTNNTDPNFIGPPEKPEISVDKNPETAVKDADNSATTVLQSGNNPTGSREPATIESRFPTISLDIGGAKLRAQFMEKDFKGTQEAMKKYEDYIQDKRDKRQTFDQYQEKYKDPANLRNFLLTGQTEFSEPTTRTFDKTSLDRGKIAGLEMYDFYALTPEEKEAQRKAYRDRLGGGSSGRRTMKVDTVRVPPSI